MDVLVADCPALSGHVVHHPGVLLLHEAGNIPLAAVALRASELRRLQDTLVRKSANEPLDWVSDHGEQTHPLTQPARNFL